MAVSDKLTERERVKLRDYLSNHGAITHMANETNLHRATIERVRDRFDGRGTKEAIDKIRSFLKTVKVQAA